MGNCVGGFRRRTTRISPWKKMRTIVICFLGVDGAGKTTIVKALQGEDLGTALPTVGFSRAEFSLKKYKIVVYDLGGDRRIRSIWATYYAEVYGVVYVVDSVASTRVAENQELVATLLECPDLMHKPILFLLNKKDLPNAVDELYFSETFQLHEMARRNKTDIRVERICAVKGTGKGMDEVIHDSMEWLVEKIAANYATIDKSVNEALKLLNKRQAQDRLERQHRLAEINALKADTPRVEPAKIEPEGAHDSLELRNGNPPSSSGAADENIKQNGSENDLIATKADKHLTIMPANENAATETRHERSPTTSAATMM